MMTNAEKIQVGNNQVAFVRKEGQVVWPQYTGRENLVLWYDFMGRTNSDTLRAVAEDLSGNGNNGTLNGFGYIDGSGYDAEGLNIDSVDDLIDTSTSVVLSDVNDWTLEITLALWDDLGKPYSSIFARQGGATVYTNFQTSNNSIRCRNFGAEFVAYIGPRIGKRILTFSYNSIAKIVTIYNNGSLIYTSTERGSFANNGFRLFGRPEKGVSSLYSFRICSRTLTPAEIQQNYLIDKQRFNLP